GGWGGRGGGGGWERLGWTHGARQPCLTRQTSAEALVDLCPVHDVPPRVDVVGAAVLVLQVIRVLPDVDAEHRRLAVHHRIVLVRRALDGNLAALVHHPRPAPAQAADPRLL